MLVGIRCLAVIILMKDIITLNVNLECFCDSFKIKRLSRKLSKDKSWITPGLKISSRHKNRLFRKLLNSGCPIDEDKYKNYRRLYKQIADKTQNHLVLIKTCYSIFGATVEDKSTIVLKSDSIVLQQVDYCKYLGVLIDSDLTWQQHIDYTYSKGIFY